MLRLVIPFRPYVEFTGLWRASSSDDFLKPPPCSPGDHPGGCGVRRRGTALLRRGSSATKISACFNIAVEPWRFTSRHVHFRDRFLKTGDLVVPLVKYFRFIGSLGNLALFVS
jgi:hypothetical protein